MHRAPASRPVVLLALHMLLATSSACGSASAQTSTHNPVEQRFLEAGLVDVQKVNPDIRVKLVNSHGRDNFFGEDFYDGLQTAYLQKAVARRLSKAQQLLQEVRPGHALLVLDAARPRSVSQAMWDQMKGTRFQKYVANPRNGSMHNYGAAVDITIVDADGELLDMGFCPFYRSKLGVAMAYMASRRRGPNKAQRANRRLLQRVMLGAGFRPLAHEWWHFDGFPKSVIRRRYRMIP